MNKIEVKVLQTHGDPGAFMMFLARLTQRGHNIRCMADLENLLEVSKQPNPDTLQAVAAMPHGTIKRFTPITVAVVGASRRFLAQARTHQVGINFVSASLQYSDYSEIDRNMFVVPYNIAEAGLTDNYLDACEEGLRNYRSLVSAVGNDEAGYVMPQGLRNILIMQANHQAWAYFIKLRGCNRNTTETQYVTLRIWDELLKTPDGKEMFAYAGPDCLFGQCREGKMSCGNTLGRRLGPDDGLVGRLIYDKWPLLLA